MDSHGTIGPDFIRIATSAERRAQVEKMHAITSKLKTKPLAPIDLWNYARVYRGILTYDVNEGLALYMRSDLSGRGATRHFHAEDISLMMDPRNSDEHFFCSHIYDVGIREYAYVQMPFPVSIARARHLSERKETHTDIKLYYNEQFMFVLATAILLYQALYNPNTNPLARNSVLIPTERGFYIGDVAPALFKTLVTHKQRLTYLGKRTSDLDNVEGHEADVFPIAVIKLRTTVNHNQCIREEADIDRQMRNILSVPQNNGDLIKLCKAYMQAGEPYAVMMQKMQPYVEALVKLVNSPVWLNRRAVRHPDSHEVKGAAAPKQRVA